jgi:hypothetical protein
MKDEAHHAKDKLESAGHRAKPTGHDNKLTEFGSGEHGHVYEMPDGRKYVVRDTHMEAGPKHEGTVDLR